MIIRLLRFRRKLQPLCLLGGQDARQRPRAKPCGGGKLRDFLRDSPDLLTRTSGEFELLVEGEGGIRTSRGSSRRDREAVLYTASKRGPGPTGANSEGVSEILSKIGGGADVCWGVPAQS